MSRFLPSALLAALCAFASEAGEKHVWMELIGFDNARSDYGVAEFLSRSDVRPSAVSILLTDPELVHSHRNLSADFPIGDFHCSYCARPRNEERARQKWTAWQLCGLVAELRRRGVAAYPSFFEVAASTNTGYAARFGAKPFASTWLDAHPEVGCQLADGTMTRSICVIKRFADGTAYEDFFAPQLVKFLRDYGFAGWHACDGFGHPRYALNEGDFSDDVLEQFAAAAPTVRIPGGDRAAKAEWILSNARPAWCRFVAKRHAQFIGKAAAALHEAGMRIIASTCWTCDPFEALWRYGVDYSLLDRAGVDGFYSEASATVLTLEGWGDRSISKLDRCRAALLRIRPSVSTPVFHLACIKDGMEQYNSLRHAPALAEAELLGLGGLACRGGRALDGVLWCLADGIRKDEWRWLDAIREMASSPVRPEGVRVVWSDRANDAELDAYSADGSPSSFSLLTRLMHAGAAVSAAVRVEDALADESMPLLVLNPALFPDGEIAALRRRRASVVEFGLGAEGFALGGAADGRDAKNWLMPLPERVVPDAAVAAAVKAINAHAAAFPDDGMAALRVSSCRAPDGALLVTAINDAETYLNARIVARTRPSSVAALTESPSLPVVVTPLDGGLARLDAKVPPRGVVLLKCQQ